MKLTHEQNLALHEYRALVGFNAIHGRGNGHLPSIEEAEAALDRGAVIDPERGIVEAGPSIDPPSAPSDTTEA